MTSNTARVPGAFAALTRTGVRPSSAARYHGYREGMGVFGEMFPGKKLTDESGGDSDGQEYRPRLDLDLDAGVIRFAGPAPRAQDESAE